MHWFSKFNMDTFRKDENLPIGEVPTADKKGYGWNIEYSQRRGITHKLVGQIKDQGIYTIVEEQAGWGKIKERHRLDILSLIQLMCKTYAHRKVSI